MRSVFALDDAPSLDDILARPDVWNADQLASASIPTVSSGFPSLDAELPGGGWPRGALTEILVDGVGLGECSLLMPALGALRAEERWSLLVGPPYVIHAPAWAAFGLDLQRLAIVAPDNHRDALWATEQALAGGALGLVLCWAPRVDARQLRRLQVAVSGSNTLAFLFRPTRAAAEASAASLRLSLSTGSRTASAHGSIVDFRRQRPPARSHPEPGSALAVNLLKRRGPPCTRTLHLDVPRPLRSHNPHECDQTQPRTQPQPHALSAVARAAFAAPAA